MGRGRVARLEFRAVRGAKKPDSLGRIGLFGAEVVSELLVETVAAHGCVFRYGKQGREGGRATVCARLGACGGGLIPYLI